ncbi:MAG TPA: hypothetical protein H9825_00795, partial [Candidatus Sphingobacterium stercorigallinarum]|nr:hypothetical protein [Candidatus Sphingobacterium stercorigallinarum]
MGIAPLQAQVEGTPEEEITVTDTIPRDTVPTDTSTNNFKEVSGQDTVHMQDEGGLETVVTITANDSSWNEVRKNV